jgi:hypothetical protein
MCILDIGKAGKTALSHDASLGGQRMHSLRARTRATGEKEQGMGTLG